MAVHARPPRQGLLGGAFFTLLAEAIALPAAVIAAMVVTRAFGPVVYGRYTVVGTTVALTEWLLIAIFARPVVKLIAETEDWRPVAATAFRVYVLTGLGIGAACWVLAGRIAAGLQDPVLAGYFRLFAIQIPVFAVMASCRNVLAGQGRYREQAAVGGAGWICRVTFIVLFVELGYGITGAILGSIFGTLTAATMALWLVGWPGWRLSGIPVRALWQVALPAFLALIFTRLLDQIGLLALEILGGDEAAVGYYGAAMNVAIVTTVIAAALTPVLISTISQAHARHDDAHVRQVVTGTLRFGLALVPFAAIVVGISAELVVLLFGADFAPAAPLMAALIVAAVARASIVLMAAILVARSHAWTAAWLAVPLPVLAVVGHVAMIPRFGAPGAALVTVTLALAGAAVSGIAVARLSGVALPIGTAARSLLIATGALAAAIGWPASGLLLLVKTGVIGVAVAAAFLAAGELSREERAVLRQQLSGGLAEAGRR